MATQRQRWRGGMARGSCGTVEAAGSELATDAKSVVRIRPIRSGSRRRCYPGIARGSNAREMKRDASVSSPRYQSSLRPNWICREAVEVLVTAPAVGEATPAAVAVGPGVNVIRLGVLKFARFSRLKNSARNCRSSRSASRVSLRAEKSQVARPGPISASRPKLP